MPCGRGQVQRGAPIGVDLSSSSYGGESVKGLFVSHTQGIHAPLTLATCAPWERRSAAQGAWPAPLASIRSVRAQGPCGALTALCGVGVHVHRKIMSHS